MVIKSNLWLGRSWSIPQAEKNDKFIEWIICFAWLTAVSSNVCFRIELCSIFEEYVNVSLFWQDVAVSYPPYLYYS